MSRIPYYYFLTVFIFINMLSSPVAKGAIPVAALCTVSSYFLIDGGIADVLGLETLTHGTNLRNYISIQRLGADPNFGGKVDGSSAGTVAFDPEKGRDYIEHSRNYFHVFKDTCSIASPLDTYIAVPLFAKGHAFFSTFALTNQSYLLASIMTLLTPTLKFRFDADHIASEGIYFEDDSDYRYKVTECLLIEGQETNCTVTEEESEGLAYKTKNAICPSHLGISGSLIYGMNTNIFHRLMNRPDKLVFGACKLAASFLPVAYVHNGYTTRPYLTAFIVFVSFF